MTTIQSFIKSTKIKPSLVHSSSSASDIIVTSGPGASVIADLWSITNVESQGSDLHIQLGSSWGFHSNYISTTELYIHGNTSNETYNDDGEILFVFSVGNQYFTEMVSLDSRKTVYKECPNKDTPLIIRDVTEMMNGALPDRYYRYCKNNISQISHGTDYWVNVGSTYKEPVQWPMFMQIINDPINYTVTYKWGDAADSYTIKVESYYTSSYPTDQGFNIYIASRSINDNFYIFSIAVTYHYTSTPAPTSNPTKTPTIAPITNNPTSLPVYYNSTIQVTTSTHLPTTSEQALEVTPKPTMFARITSMTVHEEEVATAVEDQKTTNIMVEDQAIHTSISPMLYAIIASSVTAAICLTLGCFVVICIARKYSKQHSNVTIAHNPQFSNIPSRPYPLKQNVCQFSGTPNNPQVLSSDVLDGHSHECMYDSNEDMYVSNNTSDIPPTTTTKQLPSDSGMEMKRLTVHQDVFEGQ